MQTGVKNLKEKKKLFERSREYGFKLWDLFICIQIMFSILKYFLSSRAVVLKICMHQTHMEYLLKWCVLGFQVQNFLFTRCRWTWGFAFLIVLSVCDSADPGNHTLRTTDLGGWSHLYNLNKILMLSFCIWKFWLNSVVVWSEYGVF